MRLVADRDPHALELLYERYAAAVLGLALQIVGHRRGAEEVTRDAFHSLWRDCDRYRPERETVLTWVLGLTRDHAVDALRRGSPTDRMRATAAAVAERRARSSDGCGCRDSCEERSAVRHAIGSLPSDQRDAIELAYFAGLTQAEIAGVLELPLTAVKSRMRAGVETLRMAAITSRRQEG